MYIKVNYNNPISCQFCGKNAANKESGVSQAYYRVIKGRNIPPSIQYITCDVQVPRCKECKDKHEKGIALIIEIVLLIGSIVAMPILAKADTFLYILMFAFLGGLFGGLLAFIVDKIDEGIKKPKLKKEGIKSVSDFKGYPPVELLLKYGFIDHKPDPAAHAPTAYKDEESWDRDRDAFYSDITELSKDNKYIVNTKN